jgi:glycoprotein-N-acetylgalactosamine 3-beta-galactosyltransferase
MVMASKETLWTRGVHVNSTWGRRCNKILFMTDVSDPEFPTDVVGVYTSKGRHFLTQKVFESFDYVYDHHANDADWFVKCDDDTYIIMDNLRYFLSDKDPKEAVFFGQHFRNTKRINYFTGMNPSLADVLNGLYLNAYPGGDAGPGRSKLSFGTNDIVSPVFLNYRIRP